MKAAIVLFEGDINSARTWWNKPIREIGGTGPIAIIATSVETGTLQGPIRRIENGVFA